MSWFGKKKETDFRRIEQSTAEIAAQLNALQMIVFEILKTVGSNDRVDLLDSLKSFLVNFGTVNAPSYVPDQLHQPYRNELSRVMQHFIKTLEKS